MIKTKSVDTSSPVTKEEKFPFWKTIAGFTKGEGKRLVIIVFISIFVGIMVAVQPLVIKYIVDNGISNTAAPPKERLTIVAIFCLIYIVVSVLRISGWAIAYKSTLKALEEVVFRIRSKSFHHIEHLCMRFHEKMSAGELFNALMGSPITNVRTYLRQMILSIPYESVSFVISLFALMRYDWILTLILVVTALTMALFYRYSRPKIRRLSSEYIQTETQTSKYLTDVLHGMDAIKVYSIEEEIFKNFNSHADVIRKEAVRLTFSQYKECVKPDLTNYVGTTLVYLVGAFSCIYRGLSTGTLFAFISSMSIILTTITAWLNIGIQKQSAVSGLQKIMAILNEKSSTPDVEDEKKRDTIVEKKSATKKNGPCIEFDNVTFAYDSTPVYENLSCKIGYNQSIGLVGSSGSGKTTFTKLIMRLYDVQGGEIKIHGRNIKDYQLHDLRMTFGVVPQNPFIFQGTIMDNIRIARPDCENIEIIKAMEIAHVHEFVNDLPKGWHTVVGDGGLNLSGGQKQRIAIARAVLGNPDILIFDEATSALDNVSERHIQTAMEELMKSHTVIIIAHRLTTIKNVDKIMVFDKGKIIEEGTFDELKVKENGAFAELLNT